jgi:hypothetical protein
VNFIHHREAADRHGEDFRKFLQAMFDSLFAVVRPFREQKRASDTARHAMIPAHYSRVDKMHASHRHESVSWA